MRKTPPKTKITGVTLVELMIGATLFLVFLFILFSLYLYSYRSWRQADIRMSVDRVAIFIAEEVSRCALTSNVNSLAIFYYNELTPSVVETTPTAPAQPYCAVTFQTPYDPDGVLKVDENKGRPIWQAHLIYYVNPQDKTLRKKRVEMTEFKTAPEIMQSGDIIPLLDGTGDIVARDVATFKVVDITSPSYAPTTNTHNPFFLQIRVEQISTSESNPEKQELRRAVRMLN